MEHALVLAGASVFGAGLWLRWSAAAVLAAFWLGRRVERLARREARLTARLPSPSFGVPRRRPTGHPQWGVLLTPT